MIDMEDTVTRDGFTLFWRGPFSNWFMRDFFVEGVKYSCGEQWMMASKAILFEDDLAYARIMTAKHPSDMKNIGRQVKNFNVDDWEICCIRLLAKGLQQKFRQHPDLLKILLNTDDTTLVEASPYDTIWGIGLGIDHPDVTNQSRWRGLNYLGQTLMLVRSRLIEGRSADLREAHLELLKEVTGWPYWMNFTSVDTTKYKVSEKHSTDRVEIYTMQEDFTNDVLHSLHSYAKIGDTYYMMIMPG